MRHVSGANEANNFLKLFSLSFLMLPFKHFNFIFFLDNLLLQCVILILLLQIVRLNLNHLVVQHLNVSLEFESFRNRDANRAMKHLGQLQVLPQVIVFFFCCGHYRCLNLVSV